MTTSREKYADYLQSDYWQKVVVAVKQRAGYRCQVCNSQHDLQTHHRTYDHRGKELDHLDDLICMCRRCHGIFHGKEQAQATVAIPAPKPLSKKQQRRLKAIAKQTEAKTLANVEIPAIDHLMPSGDPIVITEQLINHCLTERGAFTTKTLNAFGLFHPLVAGWRDRLVGTSISRQAYRQALEGKWQFARQKTLEMNKQTLAQKRGNDATA